MTEEEMRRLRAEARQEYLAMNYPTLRDSFAMAALSGLMANRLYTTSTTTSESLAEQSYHVADAMLAERAKGEA